MRTIKILIFIMFFVANFSEAATVSLSWDPPTTNADGSPCADLAGYKIYWGTAGGIYTDVLTATNCVNCPAPSVGFATEFECLLSYTQGVTYFFAVTAFDTFGNESDFSNEVFKTIPIASNPIGNIYTVEASTATRVDGLDLMLIGKCFGAGINGPSCTIAGQNKWSNCGAADLNDDGKVDAIDLGILSGNFGN